MQDLHLGAASATAVKAGIATFARMHGRRQHYLRETAIQGSRIPRQHEERTLA
ncbi:hypothetical protein [Alloactinosynnema sp. L-07]|nr:hypothetical protein [Alloactinosynnema sp. L-07]